MKRIIAVLFAASLLASCNINYEKTSSGLTYKIIKGNGTVKPKVGEFVKFNLEYILEDRDSVWQSTFGKIPVYGSLDTGKGTAYTYMEILPLMNVGDSAVISINIDSLKRKGLIQDYNPLLVKGQILLAKVKLIQVFKDEKTVVADYNNALSGEKDVEIKSLQDYITKNNLKVIKTKNGAFVVIDKPGDQSNKADSGKVATVMYRGYLATTGKVFDTNMDTTKGHTDPVDIHVGTRGAIQGFSECLPYFGKGGEGKFLIPAMLGYGPQAQSADLPAFANLVFDIKVTDVKDAPAQSQQQMSPEMQRQLMEQMQQQQQRGDSSNR